MRNPSWHRDEIILALELYFDENRGSIDNKNEKIVALSALLNQLPIFGNKHELVKFRNPNGVSLKLSNFLSLDPSYHGKGMRGSSALDRELFEELSQDRDKLRRVADEIKKITLNPVLNAKINTIGDDDFSQSAFEGKIIYSLHRLFERDAKIVMLKKKNVLSQTHKLECEACLFDFNYFYGSIGFGYIECHHNVPLSYLSTERRTSIEELSLVCSNCHRMLHRTPSILTVPELRRLIADNPINHMHR